MYAFKGHEYRWLKGEGDPYAIQNTPGVDRALMKQVFITSVNAASREEAVLSIRGDINKGYRALKSTTAFIDTLIDTTTSNHPEISEYFFSSAWAGLQYQDSEIAQDVLKHMQAKGYVALPIHDSFVTQDSHRAQLFSQMKEAYRTLGVESVPDIKVELGAYSSDIESDVMLSQVIREHETANKSELEGIKALEDLEPSE